MTTRALLYSPLPPMDIRFFIESAAGPCGTVPAPPSLGFFVLVPPVEPLQAVPQCRPDRKCPPSASLELPLPHWPAGPRWPWPSERLPGGRLRRLRRVLRCQFARTTCSAPLCSCCAPPLGKIIPMH